MKVTDEEIIYACNNEPTMAKAASSLGIHFNTLKSRAITLGCYTPNQGGKGISKKHNGTKIPTNEILNGKHPHYQTNKLRIRLINEGIKNKECEVCGITEWCGMRVSFELDHIDGDRTNHKLNNLRIICPNCHSQTKTYRGRNI
jgi:hypothetical protein